MSFSRREAWALAAVVAVVGLAQVGWRWQVEQRQGAALAAVARAGDIEMISSLTCVYCAEARRFLTQHQVPFNECFVERDAACAARYQALGARGTPTVLVRGQAQLGFDAERVTAVLAAPRS